MPIAKQVLAAPLLLRIVTGAYSWLFEEPSRQGALISDFSLNEKKVLGGTMESRIRSA